MYWVVTVLIRFIQHKLTLAANHCLPSITANIQDLSTGGGLQDFLWIFLKVCLWACEVTPSSSARVPVTVLRGWPLKSGSARAAIFFRLKPGEVACGIGVILLKVRLVSPSSHLGYLFLVGIDTENVFVWGTSEAELWKWGYFLLNPEIMSFS